MKTNAHTKLGGQRLLPAAPLLDRILIQTLFKSAQKIIKSWFAGYANILTFLILKFLIPLGLIIGESRSQALPLPIWQNISKPIYSANDHWNALFVKNLAVGFNGKLGVLVGNNDHKFVFGSDKPLPGIPAAREEVSKPTENQPNNHRAEDMWVEIVALVAGYLLGWLAYDVCEDICHWRRTMRSNEPSSPAAASNTANGGHNNKETNEK
jgi:hypothetical protein